MEELNEAQIGRLSNAVNKGQIIRSFCQHPGFKIYKQVLEDKIADKKNTWLNGSDEDAKVARIRAQGIQEAMDELKKFMLQGDQAANILDQNVAPVAER